MSDSRAVVTPGLHYKIPVLWANNASRGVEKKEGIHVCRCGEFLVLWGFFVSLDHFIFVSCYCVKAKGHFESWCRVSMGGRMAEGYDHMHFPVWISLVHTSAGHCGGNTVGN